jgi:hypothetical protein
LSVSFCGVSVEWPAPDVVDRISTLLDPAWLLEFASRTWPEQSISYASFQGALPTKPTKIGSLYWPTGAAKFAVGHYIVQESQLAAIRAAGGKGPLIISDGQRSISPVMRMLAARPVERVHGNLVDANGNVVIVNGKPLPIPALYIVTLADDRLDWWFRAGKITVDGTTTTWAQLYAQIATALGITITADTVPAAYLVPSNELTLDYPTLPLLLDAVAFSCGQRIVRRTDGTVLALNATSGQAAFAANLNLAVRLEGDVFDLVPYAQTDLNTILPSSVTVTFPGQGGPTWIEQVTLTSLSLSEMGTAAGFNGTKTLRTSLAATYTPPATIPTNEATLLALAKQAASDWYRWMAEGIDACYSGCVPWVFDGIVALAEYVADANRVTTRVERGPYLDHSQTLLIGNYFGPGKGCQPATGTAKATTFIPARVGAIAGVGQGIIQTVVGQVIGNLAPGTVIAFDNVYLTPVPIGADFVFVTEPNTCTLLCIPPPPVLSSRYLCSQTATCIRPHSGSGSGEFGSGAGFDVIVEVTCTDTWTGIPTKTCFVNPPCCPSPVCCNFSDDLCVCLANVSGCPCLDGVCLTFIEQDDGTWLLPPTLVSTPCTCTGDSFGLDCCIAADVCCPAAMPAVLVASIGSCTPGIVFDRSSYNLVATSSAHCNVSPSQNWAAVASLSGFQLGTSTTGCTPKTWIGYLVYVCHKDNSPADNVNGTLFFCPIDPQGGDGDCLGLPGCPGGIFGGGTLLSTGDAPCTAFPITFPIQALCTQAVPFEFCAIYGTVCPTPSFVLPTCTATVSYPAGWTAGGCVNTFPACPPELAGAGGSGSGSGSGSGTCAYIAQGTIWCDKGTYYLNLEINGVNCDMQLGGVVKGVGVPSTTVACGPPAVITWTGFQFMGIGNADGCCNNTLGDGSVTVTATQGDCAASGSGSGSGACSIVSVGKTPPVSSGAAFVNTISKTALTFSAASRVIVQVYVWESNAAVSCTYSGTTMPVDATEQLPSIGGLVSGSVTTFSVASPLGAVGVTIQATLAGGATGNMFMTVEQVTGLALNVVDQGGGNNGVRNQPNTGTILTDAACSYAAAAFILEPPPLRPWGNSFTGGQSGSIGGAGNSAECQEGRQIVPAASTNVAAVLNGQFPQAWASNLVVYK